MKHRMSRQLYAHTLLVTKPSTDNNILLDTIPTDSGAIVIPFNPIPLLKPLILNTQAQLVMWIHIQLHINKITPLTTGPSVHYLKQNT